MNIYEKALKTWGRDAQLGMVQEECAELIKAINKWWRGKATWGRFEQQFTGDVEIREKEWQALKEKEV